MVVMTIRRTHPSIQLSFLLENQDGVKTTTYKPLLLLSFKLPVSFYGMVNILFDSHINLTTCVQRIYELVVRHFLACLSQPAVGAETTVEIDIAGEMFSASGRMIIAVSSNSLFFQIKAFHLVSHGCPGWPT